MRLPPYRYIPKHHWDVKLNFLSGITLVPLLVLLARHWRSIHWWTYPHRVIFLTFMSVINSVLALLDWIFFSRAVAAQELHPEPLFILGHPRTGTTHLHNLLSTDPRFAFATTFHAGFPSSFLSLEPARWLLSGLLERRRPMDHMALDWDLPAEDEIAVNVMTGGDSPYMALVLPGLWRPLLRSYLTFGAAGPAATEPAAFGVAAGAAVGAMAGADAVGGSHSAIGEGGNLGAAEEGIGEGGGAENGDAGTDHGEEGGSRVACSSGRAEGPKEEEEKDGGLQGDQWAEPRVTAAAFSRWLAAFTWFMKKVTYRHVRHRRRLEALKGGYDGTYKIHVDEVRVNGDGGGGTGGCTPTDSSSRQQPSPPFSSPAAAAGPFDASQSSPSCPPPLLIKSPVHTARLGTWLKLFPRARFIYVHRHPLEVFQSAANMADTYYWYTYLQQPTDNGVNDFIMDQYDILYRSYMAERGRVPPGRLVEVAFSDLDSDPLGVLRRIYREFGWGEHFDAAAPRFQRYLDGLADFKKNHFNRLAPETEAAVRQRWAESFRAFGYS